METSAMRCLVVYYSFEGATRWVAERIAEATGAELLALQPEREISKSGKFLWGGRQVVMGTRPPLLPFDHDPADYDLLFIGTPVWAFTFAPALRTFLQDQSLAGKRVALFCTHEGGPGKTLANMQKAAAPARVVAELDLCKPVRTPTNAATIAAWARKVLAAATN